LKSVRLPVPFFGENTMHSAERWLDVRSALSWKPPPWFFAWWRSRARPVPFFLAIAAALAAWRGVSVDLTAPSPRAALAEVLAGRGLTCEAADVTWIDGPAGVAGAVVGGARALVRASRAGEPSDLYLVEARVSPEGVVLDVGDAWNVTSTTGVDESRPLVRRRLAAYTTTADGLFTGVHVLDLAGRTARSYEDFTRVQRAQVALTNLQQTGQTAGIVHDTFALDPVAHTTSLAWRDDGMLEVHADDHVVVIDAVAPSVVSGETYVRVVPDERARPGNVVTWSVDRVRAMPWFGDEKMQWVKAIAFTALDKVNATFSHGTTAQDVADELGLAAAAAPNAETFVDPEVGWPPTPLKVPVSPPLPGEGQWIALDKDPFITPTAGGAPAAFVTSFLRPNAHRQDVRIYVTLWDPRQVALHMEAGTVEPISANGEHGPGLVPRTPEVMKHLVAGFNGGFQAEHGEFGMEANGIEYLPPKPYAATVVELRDGSNAFGVWPDSADVPDDVIAFRQNLTALVQNDKFNPWGRNWWGGTPPGWPDQIHSARSAICLTKEGFAGYFYSTSISPEDLAQGMLVARCSFGIHLDMNPGHAGFEFYDVALDGQLAPLGRPMQSDWEAEGKVPELPGFVFRSRRMIRGMGHMLFPRYIHREARDFFYLTTRSILPGAPIAEPNPQPDEGVWRTKGLPQHGFPYAVATTWARGAPDGARADLKLRVVRADPRTMRPSSGAPAETPTVLELAAPTRGPLSLWWSGGVFSIAQSAPTKDATVLASGVPASSPQAAAARAAVGVQDEDGMLVWIELPADAKGADAATAAAMDALLDRLGCSTRILVPGDARALLGGTLDAAGAPLPAASVAAAAVRLVRAQAPGARTIFDDTPLVPIEVWRPLEAKRVRYFYKPPPAASGSASGATPPTSPAPGPTPKPH
jgi:hypothetical protein